MAQIGPNNPSIQRQIQNQAVQQNQRQQNAVETDVNKAKAQNVSTLGRQNVRTAEDKKVAQTPQEKVTLSTPKSEAPESDQVSQARTEAPPSVSTPTTEEAAPKEKSADELKTEFFNAFADNLSQKDAESIGRAASQSLTELAGSGAGDVQHEKVVVAHTYNHAKSVINAKMPNASQKEIREAAKSDPELAKAVKLMDSSVAYIKAAQKEEAGASAQAGAPVEGTGASASGPVDPFAAHRAGSSAQGPGQGQQPPDAGQPTPPPDAGQPNPPYHLTPENQAQMMAENRKTMEEINKIYTQMFADMQKAAAQRHQIWQETSISISEIMMSLHARRAQSHAKHFQTYLSILTDRWG